MFTKYKHALRTLKSCDIRFQKVNVMLLARTYKWDQKNQSCWISNKRDLNYSNPILVKLEVEKEKKITSLTALEKEGLCEYKVAIPIKN